MDGAKTNCAIICEYFFAINSSYVAILIIRKYSCAKYSFNLYKNAYFSIITYKLRIITSGQI
jgi:hypothetical protein